MNLGIESKLSYALGFIDVLTKTKGLVRISHDQFVVKIKRTKKNHAEKKGKYGTPGASVSVLKKYLATDLNNVYASAKYFIQDKACKRDVSRFFLTNDDVKKISDFAKLMHADSYLSKKDSLHVLNMYKRVVTRGLKNIMNRDQDVRMYKEMMMTILKKLPTFCNTEESLYYDTGEGGPTDTELSQLRRDEIARVAEEAKAEAKRRGDAAEAKRRGDAAEAKRRNDAAEAKRRNDAAEAKRRNDAQRIRDGVETNAAEADRRSQQEAERKRRDAAQRIRDGVETNAENIRIRSLTTTAAVVQCNVILDQIHKLQHVDAQKLEATTLLNNTGPFLASSNQTNGDAKKQLREADNLLATALDPGTDNKTISTIIPQLDTTYNKNVELDRLNNGYNQNVNLILDQLKELLISSTVAQDAEIARRNAIDDQKIRNTEDEAKRKTAEDEAKRKAAEDEAKRKTAEDEAKRKAAEDEAKRKTAEDEAKRKAAEDEAKRKAAEDEAKRKTAEDEAKRKAAEDEAKRKTAEDSEARTKLQQQIAELLLLIVNTAVESTGVEAEAKKHAGRVFFFRQHKSPEIEILSKSAGEHALRALGFNRGIQTDRNTATQLNKDAQSGDDIKALQKRLTTIKLLKNGVITALTNVRTQAELAKADADAALLLKDQEGKRNRLNELEIARLAAERERKKKERGDRNLLTEAYHKQALESKNQILLLVEQMRRIGNVKWRETEKELKGYVTGSMMRGIPHTSSGAAAAARDAIGAKITTLENKRVKYINALTKVAKRWIHLQPNSNVHHLKPIRLTHLSEINSELSQLNSTANSASEYVFKVHKMIIAAKKRYYVEHPTEKKSKTFNVGRLQLNTNAITETFSAEEKQTIDDHLRPPGGGNVITYTKNEMWNAMDQLRRAQTPGSPTYELDSDSDGVLGRGEAAIVGGAMYGAYGAYNNSYSGGDSSDSTLSSIYIAALILTIMLMIWVLALISKNNCRQQEQVKVVMFDDCHTASKMLKIEPYY
jgi:membrane protein involved in colicin uptake